MKAGEIRKQFIAGARCPACGAMDKVQRWEENGSVWLGCVSCEHREKLEEQEPALAPDETIITLE